MNIHIGRLYCLALCLALAIPASALEYRVGIRAKSGIDHTKQRWQKTLELLENKIPNAEFTLIPVLSLSKLEQLAKDKRIDFVLTNPSSFVEIQRKFSAEALVTLLNKRGGMGESQFGSVIFTLAANKEIFKIGDLRGKAIAAVSEPAFGGWRVAWYEMLRNQFDPYQEAKQIIFAKGITQEEVVFTVLSGRADAGVVRTDQLERMAARGQIDLRYIRVINNQINPEFPFFLSTSLYPEWPLAALSHVEKELRDKVKKTLLDIKETDVAAVTGQYVSWIEPLDYSPVQHLLEELMVGPYQDKTHWKERGVSAVLYILLTMLLLSGLYVIKRLSHSIADRMNNLFSYPSMGAQLSILLTVLIGLSVFATSYFFYHGSVKYIARHSLQDLSLKMEKSASIIVSNIQNAKKDLQYISKIHAIQEYIDSSGSLKDSAKQRLEELLEKLLQEKTDYLNVRYIDMSGRERIKVAREDSRIMIYPDNLLQDKNGREYFYTATQFATDKVLFSKINLNREYGKIEVPHVPIIRLTKSLFDQNGNSAGILVVNVLIGKSMRALEKFYDKSDTDLYITDDHGDYLLHPDPKKVFGFDLHKQYRIQEDFPAIAPLYLPNNKLERIILNSDAHADRPAVFSRVWLDSEQRYPYIMVGLQQDYSGLLASENEILDLVIWLAVGILSLGLLAGHVLVKLALRPILQTTIGVQEYIKKGERSIRLPTHRRDEPGVLAQAFIRLMDKIEENEAALKRYNLDLRESMDQTERKLSFTEEKYESILNTIGEVVITIDEGGKIESLNQSAKSLLHHRQDLVGANLQDILPGLNYQQLPLNSIKQTVLFLDESKSIHAELQITEMQLLEKKCLNISIRDITERMKLYEEMAVARDEAEKANEAKSQFLSRMSHELRTPLNAILGFSQLMELEKLSDDQNLMNREILMAGRHLLDLINEILDLARIEAGRLQVRSEIVDLQHILQDCVGLVQAQAEVNHNNIETEINGEVEVIGDPIRIKQIVLNLLSNAIKYGGSNGKILLRCMPKGQYNRIEVHDYGEGLDEQSIRKLFQPFERLNDSVEGTGIGLVISKHLTELMGGEIGVQSKKGSGSVFWVDLSKPQKGTVSVTVGQSRPNAGGKFDSVLYISEDASCLAVLSQMLGSMNIELLSANNIEQAMAVAMTCIPSVIILDQDLPCMSELTLVQRFQKIGQLKNVPLILIGEGEPKETQNAIPLGVKVFLQKPISMPELLGELEHYLTQYRQRA